MRIKKVSQYIEGGAHLSNVYGTSNENGYTQEYINSLNTYSTTEQRVGTWIDNKPLYSRTIVETGLDCNSTSSITLSDSATINIKKIEGYNIGDTGIIWNYIMLTSTSGTIEYNRSMAFWNGSTIRTYCGSTISTNNKYDTYLTIYYTKTTD